MLFKQRPDFPSGLRVLLVDGQAAARQRVAQQRGELSYKGETCCPLRRFPTFQAELPEPVEPSSVGAAAGFRQLQLLAALQICASGAGRPQQLCTDLREAPTFQSGQTRIFGVILFRFCAVQTPDSPRPRCAVVPAVDAGAACGASASSDSGFDIILAEVSHWRALAAPR